MQKYYNNWIELFSGVKDCQKGKFLTVNKMMQWYSDTMSCLLGNLVQLASVGSGHRADLSKMQIISNAPRRVVCVCEPFACLVTPYPEVSPHALYLLMADHGNTKSFIKSCLVEYWIEGQFKVFFNGSAHANITRWIASCDFHRRAKAWDDFKQIGVASLQLHFRKPSRCWLEFVISCHHNRERWMDVKGQGITVCGLRTWRRLRVVRMWAPANAKLGLQVERQRTTVKTQFETWQWFQTRWDVHRDWMRLIHHRRTFTVVSES